MRNVHATKFKPWQYPTSHSLIHSAFSTRKSFSSLIAGKKSTIFPSRTSGLVATKVATASRDYHTDVLCRSLLLWSLPLALGRYGTARYDTPPYLLSASLSDGLGVGDPLTCTPPPRLRRDDGDAEGEAK